MVKEIVQSKHFQNFVLALIVFNAILLGIETSERLMSKYQQLFLTLNVIIQILFVSELSLRIATYWPDPKRFFREGWNIFDFIIVVLSLLPVAGAFAGVARLARVLRIARVISLSPNLKLIIETMLLSIPSMGHVVILLSLMLYIYGIIGFYLFSDIDPLHWGNLALSFLTLFQVITLEGWVEIQRILLPTYPFAWLYFVSFIVIAVFVVINLFIAVVTNNLQMAKLNKIDDRSLKKSIAQIREDLNAIETQLERIALTSKTVTSKDDQSYHVRQ